MTLTPNSSVSRTVQVRISVGAFASILRRAIVDDDPAPVRILFDDSTCSVWTHDIARTIQVYVTRWSNPTLKTKEPCCLLVDPKETLGIISTKWKPEDVIEITTEAAQPILFKSRDGASVTVMPADEDECNMCPDRWVLPLGEHGDRMFPMFDNEAGTHNVDIALTELRRGASDMQVAKAPYVEFSFSHSGSTATAGHWTSKSVRSSSPVDFIAATTRDFTVTFTENLSTILSRFDSATTTLRLTKHERAPFVVLDAVDGPDVSVVATEAIKEMN